MSVTLEALQGRVLDVSSLEQMRLDRYPDLFGERARRSLEASAEVFGPLERAFGGDAKTDVPDTMAITPETVWMTQRYGTAPSASDLDRRPAVLDVMGIRCQLVFPIIGLLTMQYLLGDNPAAPDPTPEQLDAGWEAMDAYNEWAGELTTKYPDRLRIAAVLASAAKPTTTPDTLVADTERLLASGVRAVVVPSARPPAGRSPADPALDPFYATLAEANTALLLRGGLWTRYRATDAWGNLPGEPGRPVIDPTFVTHVHHAEENFLTAMVIGGVFERHPTLRFGVIKVGASWIGPLAERMDAGMPPFMTPDHLPLKPSEYLARNVRVSVFGHEPVNNWLARHPTIQDVYCYSSDYPAHGGGQWSLRTLHERLTPSGDDLVEKFFCTNAQLLLP